MAKYCEKCGAVMNDNMLFCTSCGASLESSEAPGNNTYQNPPIEQNSDLNQDTYNQIPEPAQSQVQQPTPEPVQYQEPFSNPGQYQNPALAQYQGQYQNQGMYNQYPNQMPNIPAKPPKKVKAKKEKKKMSKAKKIGIILIAILVVLLALLITATIMFFTGSARKTYKDMEEKSYSSALTEYRIGVQDSFVQGLIFDYLMGDYDEEVVEAFENNELDYESTVEALNVLQEMGFGDMSATIDEITSTNEENNAYEKGNEYVATGDYENAISEYQKVTSDNKNYEDVQTKLSELYPQYISSVIENAKSYSAVGDYEEALTLINTVISTLPESVDSSELSSSRTEILNSYKAEVVTEVTELINDGEYLEAIEEINEAIEIDDNEDFQNTKTTAENSYVESVTATVNEYLELEDYISAERAVDSALSNLPDNDSLIALQEKVESETPTYLLDVCMPYSSDGFTEYTLGETFSMGGVEYTNGFTIYEYGNAVFNLGGDYESVSFQLGHVDETDNVDVVVKIYCDGVLKETYKPKAENLSVKKKIDVTGVSQLKIVIEEADDNDDWWGQSYGFGNVIVK
ncbi:MAG: NPCBM/NEW2 domain-containing protein [Ruminococcus sp.]|nr:NPCBM/NEW2 domain-containing protein [Ruminococcus sp.]